MCDKMSVLTRLIPNFLATMQRSAWLLPQASFHSLTQNAGISVPPGGLFHISVRNNIRCHFPRPSERKRIKRHGYWYRMSTPASRRILMRRILRGKHVLSH